MNKFADWSKRNGMFTNTVCLLGVKMNSIAEKHQGN